MKLLLDENISYRVLKIIEAHFPGSIHITSLKTSKPTDIEIFLYPRSHDFTIVTFDEDFSDLLMLKGAPPKVIWLRCGNSSNLKIANKLLEARDNIHGFLLDGEKTILEIY